ncbi:hypothetical protein A3D00_05235 [Candidatus Woesebacteria bacterium RIFCSPHIGHO2_02_FULL_38_9]|uniref:Antitoxin n=1 Tax=Candidatus Woesebacteria bacterium RIFCSPHIGHO2_01_FULL_39_28 TaxID=1802496 RepID=A0A1F7YID5_9BACT|nr:MAG: hypothetical protein A2627_01830 [Candidatus Woesebacteria bacterium RIFCSPHIGHO2_01_FULL_39_28]OGM32723.1 MAG: hypothetical protein A3D00_05235 [Candidatus Woesebacteria bacterium RIFCSPHIGHO2_02_FULL_38_9]OGM57013.1 MAG: hypothetical protein A3A50_03445 [Candidatus Woesebacteria bacterium RIFCSPLOWO2_01_FULL_38_20]
MRVISTNDFRDKLADYIDDVYKTETALVVSRFGRPLVKIVPYKKEEVDDFEKYFGFLKGGNDEDGVSFENRIRRSKKEGEFVKRLRKGRG